jgi:hypothetical protein
MAKSTFLFPRQLGFALKTMELEAAASQSNCRLRRKSNRR